MTAPLHSLGPHQSLDGRCRRMRGTCPRAVPTSSFDAGSTPRVPSGFIAINSKQPTRLPVLALGSELKSGICLFSGHLAMVSQQHGDLTHPDCFRQYVRAIDRLLLETGIRPGLIAHDLHPLYMSTRYARNRHVKSIAVQHHHAHVAAVATDCGASEPLVGICCDGVGLGTDGAAWGCEILFCNGGWFRRLGHMDYFPLVGGDAAAIANWRPAAALLHQAYGSDWRSSLPMRFGELSCEEFEVAHRTFDRALNTHQTSSLGRVFDGVSYMLGLCRQNDSSKSAAVLLERAATGQSEAPYPSETSMQGGGIRMSMTPITRAIVHELRAGTNTALIASRFHESIARMLADSAVRACELSGSSRVVLAGGCFVNKLLTARVTERLSARRLQVLSPRRISFGDENIALGQAVVAAAMEIEDQ